MPVIVQTALYSPDTSTSRYHVACLLISSQFQTNALWQRLCTSRKVEIHSLTQTVFRILPTTQRRTPICVMCFIFVTFHQRDTIFPVVFPFGLFSTSLAFTWALLWVNFTAIFNLFYFSIHYFCFRFGTATFKQQFFAGVNLIPEMICDRRSTPCSGYDHDRSRPLIFRTYAQCVILYTLLLVLPAD